MINCIFEDGGNGSLRHVTIDGIVEKDNKILLVKRASHLTEGGKWALPGGFLDRDESAEEGVRREILEESGYAVSKLVLFMIISYPDRPREDRQNVNLTFIAVPHDKATSHDKEVEEIRWFSLPQIPHKKAVAFDHYMIVSRYLSYRKSPIKLPILI